MHACPKIITLELHVSQLLCSYTDTVKHHDVIIQHKIFLVSLNIQIWIVDMQCYTHLCTCNIPANGDEELLVLHAYTIHALILSITNYSIHLTTSYLIHLMNKGSYMAIANWYPCW